MKKNKKEAVNQPVVTPEQQPEARSTTAFPLSEMSPSEELQIYYNDAYMREKQRFNDMFGIIDEPQQQNPLASSPAPQQEDPFSTPYAQETPAYAAQTASAGTYGYAENPGKKDKKRLSPGARIGIAILVTAVVAGILIGICNTLLF